MYPHMVYVQYNYRDEIPVHVCVRDRHSDSDTVFSFFSKLGKELLLLLAFGLSFFSCLLNWTAVFSTDATEPQIH